MRACRFPQTVPGMFVLLLCVAWGGASAGPAEWAGAMHEARASYLAGIVDESGFRPYASPTKRGGEAADRVSLDVQGLARLCLRATIGPDDYHHDQAVWGEPVLIDHAGNVTRLVDLEPASVSVGWGNLLTSVDLAGNPLRVGERTFEHGFWAHAPSRLEFDLGGRFVRFEAWVGICAAAGGNGSSEFLVPDSALDRLWADLALRFPEEAAAFEADTGGRRLAWFASAESTVLERQLVRRIMRDPGGSTGTFEERYAALRSGESAPDDPGWLALYAEVAAHRAYIRLARARIGAIDLAALRRAIEDLGHAYPDVYPAAQFLSRLEACEAAVPGLRDAIARGEEVDFEALESAAVLQREALLANPLLDFDRILLVKRPEGAPDLGLPANWQGNCCLARSGFDDEIVLFDWKTGALDTLFRPESPAFVGDLDLHWDADRLLFSMPGAKKRWQVWELDLESRSARQVTPGGEPDVDHYDACYLPDGRVILGSTAPMRGVPCVDGSSHVANLFIVNADGTGMRQLCFDQDHNWCPEVLPNGRVLYSRWEYTDTPHSQTRLLFHMNPDGTGQMEFYGSNSYWPNGVFYARPVPGHPSKVIGIVTGHHGVRRMGELVLFDVARGRREAEGAVQRIPGWGKEVQPIIRDQLVDDSWPKFLHPWPLSDQYFLVAGKPNPESRWGIYLADVFDNLLLLKELPGSALLEPIPLRPRPAPPVIPDKVDLRRDDALVYLANVYEGPGLEGIPRGTVESLRIFTYHYGYRGMGGLLGVIGMDGPWDIKRVLGTVPVEPDGSALFRVPANTPVSVQPLDADGQALQLMRSWMTAMPGEVLSCVGCHEQQSSSPPSQTSLAALRAPSDIAPWHGPERGFSFAREVQPVLDHYCVRCHDGAPRAGGKSIPDLRGTEPLTGWESVTPGQGGRLGGRFTRSYAELHRFVRRPGIESDYHLLTPMEFHAGTTELVQMLRAGHRGVELNDEAWDRLITWIDLNTPFHGYWHEIEGRPALRMAARQVELSKRYANVDVNPETVPDVPAPVFPEVRAADGAAQAGHAAPECADWPFDADEARRRQAGAASLLTGAAPAADYGASSPHTRATLDLGGGVKMDFVLIPPGAFPFQDTIVTIEQPFWMAAGEVSNAQYARFDPEHDSRVESKNAYQFGVHGFPLNEPGQPVVRVSWERARAFGDWLSREATPEPGMAAAFTLPTEVQWEYACRAGAATPFWYGGLDTDFSAHANLADAKLADFADDPYKVYSPLRNPTPYDDWIPKDARFNDGVLVSAPIGQFAPNPWGLHDMHGNVWEWTATEAAEPDKRIVRGGSWRDRPKRATASSALAYDAYQRVFNVGFRVVCPVAPEAAGRLAQAQ